MTNSEVLQYIIEELGKSALSWSGDQELFELICAPLPYLNEAFQKRKEIKQSLLELYPYDFDDKKFNALVDDIICGENESNGRKELLNFLTEQARALKIDTIADISELVSKTPCRGGGEKNYKSNFSNWKNGKTKKINAQEVKQKIEKNFSFSPSLWDMSAATVKQAVREGITQFVYKQTKEVEQIVNIFDEIRSEFKMQETMREKETKVLESFKTMSEKEMMEYIASNYPLAKIHTQKFIQELIPILYHKGYYELLLHDVIEALDIHLQESNHIRKIKAHIYGSAQIGEYIKAFNILSMIESENDTEIVDMRTEAISNIRRHYLSNTTMCIEEKQESINALITHYADIFKHNDTFHYYPAINLVYMIVIETILSQDEKKCQLLTQIISDIFNKCKPSIMIEEKSDDVQKRYFAHITKLEFSLLKGIGSPISEIARFLELEENHIPLVSLTRTHRQMQFFIDSIRVVQGLDYPTMGRVQSAIEVINDFMEFKVGS